MEDLKHVLSIFTSNRFIVIFVIVQVLLNTIIAPPKESLMVSTMITIILVSMFKFTFIEEPARIFFTLFCIVLPLSFVVLVGVEYTNELITSVMVTLVSLLIALTISSFNYKRNTVKRNIDLK